MEIWSCKSSAQDESKISIHVSDVSDVSSALRRLTFLPDTCLRHMSDVSACDAYEASDTCKIKSMCPHVSHVSPPLRRLAFLGDTCLKPYAACVPRGIRVVCPEFALSREMTVKQ